jgi:ankyrin repeat protein
MTALLMATANGQFEVVKLLLQNGANINDKVKGVFHLFSLLFLSFSLKYLFVFFLMNRSCRMDEVRF